MNECIWYNVQINIIADSILNNLNLLFLLFLLSLNIVNFNDNNFTTQSLDDRNWRLLKHTDALVTRYPCVDESWTVIKILYLRQNRSGSRHHYTVLRRPAGGSAGVDSEDTGPGGAQLWTFPRPATFVLIGLWKLRVVYFNNLMTPSKVSRMVGDTFYFH